MGEVLRSKENAVDDNVYSPYDYLNDTNRSDPDFMAVPKYQKRKKAPVSTSKGICSNLPSKSIYSNNSTSIKAHKNEVSSKVSYCTKSKENRCPIYRPTYMSTRRSTSIFAKLDSDKLEDVCHESVKSNDESLKSQDTKQEDSVVEVTNVLVKKKSQKVASKDKKLPASPDFRQELKDVEERLSDKIFELQKQLQEYETKFNDKLNDQANKAEEKLQGNKKRKFNLENINEEEEEEKPCENKSCLVERLQQRDDSISKLKEDIKKRDEEIAILKNQLNEQMKFSCEQVFHSYVVYKGTDNIVSCDCRKDYTLYLPDEILLQIFKTFPQSSLHVFSKVCRRWKRLCYDSSMWKKVDLKSKEVSLQDLEGYLMLGVENLDLEKAQVTRSKSSSILNLTPMPSDKRRISKLKWLNMCSVDAEISICEKVISKCRGLEFLDISFCGVNNKIFSQIEKNVNLKTLCMRSITKTYTQDWFRLDISKILKNCSKLEILDISDSVFGFMLEKTVFPSSLKELSLDYVLSGNHDNECFKRIIQLCPRLTFLSISWCRGLSSDIISFIVADLAHLQILVIRGMEELLLSELYLLCKLKNFSELQGHFEEPILTSLQQTLKNVKIVS